MRSRCRNIDHILSFVHLCQMGGGRTWGSFLLQNITQYCEKKFPIFPAICYLPSPLLPPVLFLSSFLPSSSPPPHPSPQPHLDTCGGRQRAKSWTRCEQRKKGRHHSYFWTEQAWSKGFVAHFPYQENAIWKGYFVQVMLITKSEKSRENHLDLSCNHTACMIQFM